MIGNAPGPSSARDGVQVENLDSGVGSDQGIRLFHLCMKSRS